jgi:hypothetical protein
VCQGFFEITVRTPLVFLAFIPSAVTFLGSPAREKKHLLAKCEILQAQFSVSSVE